jgi:peptidoglycan-associated lipoprotein
MRRPALAVSGRPFEEWDYMLRVIAGLKIAAVCAGLVLVAGCSSSNRPDVAPQEQAAVPGSEKDFLVNVGDRVYFIVDQSTLTPQAQETLRRQAAWLAQYPNVTVQIEGHADEQGTREYNIALSARRATATRNYLASLGVNPTRMSTIAYGKERPVAVCSDESCYSQNRRAVTVITGGAVTG